MLPKKYPLSTGAPSPKPKRRGQAFVEFALILPLLLVLLFGIIEFACIFQAWMLISNSARYGVRYAVTGEYNPAYCVDYDGDSTPCGGASQAAEEDQARLMSI